MTTLTTSRPWFGLHLPLYTFEGAAPGTLFDRVVEQAQAAEAAGFSVVTVMDHLYQIPGVGAVTEPMVEGWSALAALARETRDVRLGTLVTGVTYRNPAMLAKLATSLDTISGGRAFLGLGAAWNEEEHIGYGFDFPPIRERMDRLDEALTIIRAMFTAERPSFEGRYYRISEALNVPRPVQASGPPIMVGGGGEQRTLRIAARHADLTHWFPLGLDTLRHKSDLLARYCEEIGRDPATIERTMASPVIVTLEAIAGGRHPGAHATGTTAVHRRRAGPAGRRRDAPVPGCRVHRVHLQQFDLPNARAHRGGRGAAPAALTMAVPGAASGPVPVFPASDAELTTILIVTDLERSRRWYEGVLGATVYRSYGGDSVVLRFAGAWLLLVTGGGPSDDKPRVTLAAPADGAVVDHLFTIRVEDCAAAYDTLQARGATFLTPPVRHGAETRAFLRDPDGHLFEISEYRPAEPPA